MFTGLVQAVGRVQARQGLRLSLTAPPEFSADEPIRTGESIAVSGCCLTALGPGSLEFDLSPETLSRTKLDRLQPGDPVNLERAMRLTDRLGGHIVQGHVDGVGSVDQIAETEGGWEFHFTAPEGARWLIDKGSICIDGVSLTVVEPEGDRFRVAVIPHTYAVTSLGSLAPGDPVHLEYDVLAKHVDNLLRFTR